MLFFLLIGMIPISLILGSNRASADQNEVFISIPCVQNLAVDINGAATNGQNVQKIVFDWGDGFKETHFFPDLHTYKNPGSYTINVTAYYNDGTTASDKVDVVVGTGIAQGCYYLQISSSDGGRVSYVRDGSIMGIVDSGNYTTIYLAQGDDLELTAIQNGVGFSFSSWSINGQISFISGGTSTPHAFIVVNGNSSINANFISPEAVPVCTPAPGSTITVGESVFCSFSTGEVEWFATNFSPSGWSFGSSETFTAVYTGDATITPSFSCQNAFLCAETYHYNVLPSTSIANCVPGDGSFLQLDQTVTCTFNSSSGLIFNGWGSTLFDPFQTPATSNYETQIFKAIYQGSGEITISYIQNGVINYESFSYQIGPNSSIASCTPDTGSTIELFSYITCRFTGSGNFEGWSAGASFNPQFSDSPVQTFQAVSTGSDSITAFWEDGSVPASESFTYNIGPSTNIANCIPGNDANIQPGQTVNCTFYGPNGLILLGWISTLFTPAESNLISQSFTLNTPASGNATITVSWEDQNGVRNAETFRYNIVSQNSVQQGALNSTITVIAHSPVNILLTDPFGRKVGSDGLHNYNQIPGAFYTGLGQKTQIIALPDAIPGNYTVQAFGRSQGAYTITFETVQDNTGKILGFQAITGNTSLGGNKTFSLEVSGTQSVGTSSNPPSSVGVPQFSPDAISLSLLVALLLPALLYIRKKNGTVKNS